MSKNGKSNRQSVWCQIHNCDIDFGDQIVSRQYPCLLFIYDKTNFMKCNEYEYFHCNIRESMDHMENGHMIGEKGDTVMTNICSINWQKRQISSWSISQIWSNVFVQTSWVYFSPSAFNNMRDAEEEMGSEVGLQLTDGLLLVSPPSPPQTLLRVPVHWQCVPQYQGMAKDFSHVWVSRMLL